MSGHAKGLGTGEIPILEEQVPIDVKLLSDLKELMEGAADTRNVAYAASVVFIRSMKKALEATDLVEAAETAVNDHLNTIIQTHGVKPEEFQRFDLNKGVVVIKRTESLN